jgi:hypothetical protein
MNVSNLLSALPPGLKNPLITEYNNILQHYLEKRWTASELSGGKFCEIVYTILDGYGKGTYAASPFKPSNFVDACKKLENNASVPRSFQILIPRMLPALYEIRNNRNVGHVGGDVDPNSMDSQAVVSICSWIMGELIRVFHNTSIADAQKIVDSVTSRKIPLVWQGGSTKRVLKSGLSVKNQILLLLISETSKVGVDSLLSWMDMSKKKPYFIKTLRELHDNRIVELSSGETEIEILPPGVSIIEEIINKISEV